MGLGTRDPSPIMLMVRRTHRENPFNFNEMTDDMDIKIKITIENSPIMFPENGIVRAGLKKITIHDIMFNV